MEGSYSRLDHHRGGFWEMLSEAMIEHNNGPAIIAMHQHLNLLNVSKWDLWKGREWYYEGDERMRR